MILLFPFIALKAQEQPATLKRNTVYFELFGQGVLYSFNYEYRIIQQVSLRAGFTSWRISLISTRFNFTGFPIMLNFLSGKKNGHFEAGIGCIHATVTYIGDEYNPFIVLESKGSSTAIGLQLCEEAAFGAQNCQHCTKVDAR
jgi:hypothetical protein